ncbi:NAD(P)-binding protein [Flagelloscypha sp. PMI_526]|nr:NAD(P)-binding protein [Flagelloscypha sp. PMI_526]
MGNYISIMAQMYPPKTKWTVDDMPDLTGKVVIVTGGNTGCGYYTVQALLKHNAKVYLAARTEGKAKEAISKLRNETGKEAIWLPLDLADLKSIRKGADEFISKENELHILFNNAGVMVSPMEMLTAQGYDLQFGTNVLGHFFFTKLLLPTMQRTAKNSQVRIINTSSSGHYAGALDFSGIWVDGAKRNKKSPGDMYVQSKNGNVVFSNELVRRYGNDNIISHSLHPGSISSDLQRHIAPLTKRIFDYLMLYPTPMGAITQLYAGTSKKGGEINGAFFIPWARIGKARKETNDEAAGRRLWDWLEAQVVGF